MLYVPIVVRSLAGIVAVNRVELTKAVVRSEPAKRTTDDPLMKFVPLTVSVSPADATTALVGLMLVVVGARLLTVNGALSSGAGCGWLVLSEEFLVAVITTPASAFEYVTPLIVT